MKKILIVEDDIDLVEVMELNLKKYGYAVDHAYNGEQAIQKVKEFKPDLIILDIMLPKLNGQLFAQTLKSDPKTQNIPIIGISGRTGIKETLIVNNELIVSSFFYKPVLMSTLVEEIKRLLKG